MESILIVGAICALLCAFAYAVLGNDEPRDDDTFDL